MSGRAHPARQPSRTPPWARNAVPWGTDAPTWPPPTAGRQRGASLVAGCHRGAADKYVRHRGATSRVERHRGAAPTALRRRGAGSVAGHHRGTQPWFQNTKAIAGDLEKTPWEMPRDFDIRSKAICDMGGAFEDRWWMCSSPTWPSILTSSLKMPTQWWAATPGWAPGTTSSPTRRGTSTPCHLGPYRAGCCIPTSAASRHPKGTIQGVHVGATAALPFVKYVGIAHGAYMPPPDGP